jgi:hypothetical protein
LAAPFWSIEPFATTRPVPGSAYQEFENCPDDSFRQAVRTLETHRADRALWRSDLLGAQRQENK